MCIRCAGSAPIAPGTPITKSNWMGSVISSMLRKCMASSSIPISKISISGTIPYCRKRRANVSTSSRLFINTPSPKFTVPVVSVAISGLHSMLWRRSSALIQTAPPVETWVMTSQCARMPSSTSRKSCASCVALPSASRT